MTFARFLIVSMLVFGAVNAGCQEPSSMAASATDDQVTAWLHSGNPRLMAWGASTILAGRRSELLPELESTIGSYTAAKELPVEGKARERLYAMAAMLDAAIQMGGSLPAEVLERLDPQFVTQEMVLLKAMPWEDAGPVWKRLYQPDKTGDTRPTRVAATMLAQHPPAGFAAGLLRAVKVQATIEVHLPGTLGGGFGSGFSSCCGVGMGPLGADWPEVGTYAFQDSPKLPDAKLWLAGEDPIYLVRLMNRTYWPSVCGGFSGLTDGMRLHLIHTMLDGDGLAVASLQPHVDVHIEFHGREEYRSQVAAFVDGQEEAFERVTAALTRKGFMTEEERQSAHLAIGLELHDFRGKGAVDLPSIAFRPPVEWVGGAQW